MYTGTRLQITMFSGILEKGQHAHSSGCAQKIALTKGLNAVKSLVLAEKPSVGREIARVLGCRQSSKSY